MSAATAGQTRAAIVDVVQGSRAVRARLGAAGVRRLAADLQGLPDEDDRLRHLTVVDGEIWSIGGVPGSSMVLTGTDLLDLFAAASTSSEATVDPGSGAPGIDRR